MPHVFKDVKGVAFQLYKMKCMKIYASNFLLNFKQTATISLKTREVKILHRISYFVVN